jgi:putative ABC transport system permease protein
MFLGTASRIAWRELRASPGKFLFVIFAVAIGVAALSGVKGFGYAFKGMLSRNAKQLIAGDLQAQVYQQPPADEIQKMLGLASRFGIMTRVTETESMAASARDGIPQMISIKAVDPAHFPFYGHLTLQPAQPLAQLLSDDSSVVVTPELLMRLRVAPGDVIRLGGQDYRITGTLITEPDRLASGFRPGMRVLMSRDGLARSGLIQFGSRAAERFLFKLKPGVDLDAAKNEIKATLHRVFISDYKDGSPIVGKAIDATTTFMSLISLIALIVGSLGVAMAMYSHLQQRMDTIAVMKAIGARAPQVIQIYMVQTLWLGLTGGFIGVALGAIVQKSFPWLIQRVFALLPDVPWDWSFSLQGLSVGVLATLLFTLPPLLAIRNIRPSLVLRRNMSDAALESRRHWKEKIPGWLGGLGIVAGFFLITVWLSGSWLMSAYFVGGLSASILLLAGVAAFMLFVLRLLVKKFHQGLPLAFRHGFANLYRPGNQARSVLVALGIGVMFTTATYLLQRTVLREVRGEGPGRQGNLFLLDIRDSSQIGLLLKDQPGVQSQLQLVGYVVARVLEKNGIAAANLPLSTNRKDQLQTARLTSADALPDGLNVLQGQWWHAGEVNPQLAVSEQAMRDFQIHLGDNVKFQIAGRTVASRVVAVFKREDRSPVRYDLVFPQAALKIFPVVYYGAVHVDPNRIPQVERAIFEKFPTITVMNLADVLARIQEAVDQVALVIRFLALFAILAGAIILGSSIAGTRYRRVREVAVLKTLGATKNRIISIFSIEFSILGAIGGFVGGVLANGFTRLLCDKFLDMKFEFDWLSLLVVMAGTALLANLAGWLASARILGQRPLEVLRGE